MTPGWLMMQITGLGVFRSKVRQWKRTRGKRDLMAEEGRVRHRLSAVWLAWAVPSPEDWRAVFC